MDQALLRIPDDVDAEPGDMVVLLGQLAGAVLTAEDIAGRWGPTTTTSSQAYAIMYRASV